MPGPLCVGFASRISGLSDLLRYSLLSLVVFITHFQEAITGFGCTVLALPFVIFLLGLDVAVKVLVIQAWILTAYIVITARADIVWRQYGRIVLFAGLGLPVGIVLAGCLPESALKCVLGVFMVEMAARGIVTQLCRHEHTRWSPTPLVNVLMNAVLFAGGIVHGAFGSGGPLVVICATRALPNKTLFRVTLCMLWLTLNTTLVLTWAAARALTPEIWLYTAICTPFTVVGMVIGDRCHHRINEHAFRLMVFGVLLLSGAAVLYSAGRH